ncbi:MAG: hypothetical protein E6H48_13920 [Betaproteobacteria bacterium]|nr:MAG: hypothetical protein E6H71_05050 [Betaproteobacteria bacterium]TMH65592.1 MAG: hypothetical protein E6H48_13920 [Betaproteobacteria bacterium]
MPTARELLEQAEALMQRGRGARMNDDIPTLTDSVPTPLDGIVGGAGFEMRRAPTSLDDIPMLTEAVEDFDTPSIPLAQSLDDELAMWRETDDVSIHVVAAADATVATEAPVSQEETPEPPETFAAVEAPIAESSPQEAPIDSPAMMAEAAPIADDSARWNALAEDIRMQVLQRIDIFTDTGLKDQLNQRLQPIVDRASADLVAAINQHVGQLLRAYVAEAIEREIEKWRENSRTTLPLE